MHSVHFSIVAIPKYSPFGYTLMLNCQETRLAIQRTVIPKGESMLLLPRSQAIISAQIELIESFRLKWETVRRDPHVCLRILPLDTGTDEIIKGIGDLSDNGENDTLESQNGAANQPLLPD